MANSLLEPLAAQARAWRDDDPDPRTRAELDALISEGRGPEIADRFAGSLEFGTAGLRGLLGAGPNRMNRRVVLRATAGLVAWLLEAVPNARARGVCIGYDGRRMSREFAADTAAVAAGAGLVVHLFDRLVPTPVLAFAVRETGAAAGVMVTASHNPPAYNGYKVYWENAAQIIPPHDREIAARIERVARVADVPRLDEDDARARGLLRTLGDAMVDRYFDGVAGLRTRPRDPGALVLAYTALHGVGDAYARRALREGGFVQVHSVPEQAEPDGEFPTVDFPNPEEKGAMDRVVALAAKVGADLALANDPDADRLAAAVRDGAGAYVMLTGNEVGCLLAHYLLARGGRPPGKRFVLSSIVSSPMIGAIARAHGAHWEPTLTGFKWIANRAMVLEREGAGDFVMGYEEALGYTVGPLVRDKDGVSAALVFAELAAECKSLGKTLLDEREVMWRRYGMYLSRQVSVTLPGADGAAKIRASMTRIREWPLGELAGLRVVALEDLQRGVRRGRDGVESPLAFEPSDVLLLDLEGGHRVMARPSGTEPKIKYYYDVNVQVGEGEPIAGARARGERMLDALVADLEAVARPR